MSSTTIRTLMIPTAIAVAVVIIVLSMHHNLTRIVPGVVVETPAGQGVVVTDEMQLAMTKEGKPLMGYKVRVKQKNGITYDIGFPTKYLFRPWNWSL